MQRLRQSCVLLLLFAAVAAAEQDGAGLYLFMIPAEGESFDSAAATTDVSLEIETAAIDLMQAGLARTNIPVEVVGDDRLRVVVGRAETMTNEPTQQHIEASFVLDYDQPEVAYLVKEMRLQYGDKPSIQQLSDFVFESIESKSYRRGFDLASQVAGSREGDCTEHAILVAALARAVGIPAQVVFGLLLLNGDQGPMVAGHAWAELYVDGWQLVDATKPSAAMPGIDYRYIPYSLLENEGPGYSLSLFDLARLHPTGIYKVQLYSPG